MKKMVFFLAMVVMVLPFYGQGMDEGKIEELLSRMTRREKIGQMSQLDGRYDEVTREKVRKGEAGSFLSFDPARMNEFQRIAVEESRLGIPLIFARDVIHGYKTVFPIPLGMASSFDPSLVERCSRVAAKEARADGIRWTFAPMVDIARDPRWGRIAEGFGEDPELVSQLGAAAVRGFQGPDLSAPESVAACAKHYAGYGGAEGGRDYNSTYIPERLMREVYLRPFEMLAANGVSSFMSAFNDNDGIPMSANRFYLRHVLREEWMYDGVVVSDWNAVDELINHGYAVDGKDAARKAIDGGVDMEMVSSHYIRYAESLLEEGKIAEKEVDDAVRNILRLKWKTGLFDRPYYDDKAERPFYCPEHLACAREAAEKSVVLLKNDNQLLPFTNSVKTVAIIGPFADSQVDQMGTWAMDGEKEFIRTPLKALEELYGKQVRFIYEPVLRSGRDTDTKNFSRALVAAGKSDVVLLFLGEESFLSGEAHSLADISLRGAQSGLLEALSQAGRPIVTVIMAGRPVPLEREAALSDALLYAWHPGTMGGDALADILFGKAVPSGKLPVTLPCHGGQIPVYYNHKNTGRPAPEGVPTLRDIDEAPRQTTMGNTSAYLDYGKDPLFVFGYGLSYTTFSYSDMQLSNRRLLSVSDSLEVKCVLTNTGRREATEIVQLYIRDCEGSVTRPVKELKKFMRVTVKPGEQKRICFVLTPRDLMYWDADMKRRAEPGRFFVWIGGNSKEGLKEEFRLE